MEISNKEFVKNHIIENKTILPPQEFNLFVQNNYFDIFELAVTPPNTEESSLSFNIVSNFNNNLINSLSTNSKFYDIINSILELDCIDNVFIMRCSSILQSVILQDQIYNDEIVNTFLAFFPYMDNSAVFDLYYTVLDEKANLTKFWNALKSSDLLQKLFLHVRSIINGNQNLEEIVDYLLIFRLLSKNEVFKIELENKKAIQEFMLVDSKQEMFDSNISLQVSNIFWSIISSLCTSNTFSYMLPLFEKSIIILSEPYLEIHIYHVCALDFMGKFISNWPNAFEKRFVQFLHVFSRLLIQFPDSSNLQASIARFICVIIKYNQFHDALIEIFLPLVVSIAQSENRNAASANCAFILHQISALKNSYPKLKHFCQKSEYYLECRKYFLDKYESLLTKNYGGPMEKDKNDHNNKTFLNGILSFLSPNFLSDFVF